MSKLHLSLIQSNLRWEDPESNRNYFEEKINELDNTDLILLPEMFTTGFSMASERLAEKMDGASIQWMSATAQAKNAVICGSLIIAENGSFFNRLIWMRPDGSFESYDKKHLFRMANEEKFFDAGQNKLIVELKGFNICPLICYDLRFPVWSRNRYQTDRSSYANAEYDLLIYVANWPAPRIEAWNKLLYARAIENQVYVAGLNRIGEDENGVSYSGGSKVIDPKGELIQEAEYQKEEVISVEIDLESLNEFREKFPLGMDADEFELK